MQRCRSASRVARRFWETQFGSALDGESANKYHSVHMVSMTADMYGRLLFPHLHTMHQARIAWQSYFVLKSIHVLKSFHFITENGDVRFSFLGAAASGSQPCVPAASRWLQVGVPVPKGPRPLAIFFNLLIFQKAGVARDACNHRGQSLAVICGTWWLDKSMYIGSLVIS